MLALAPISLRQARAFVFDHHRHARRLGAGATFAVALLRTIEGSQAGAELVGVGIAGRPVARGLQNGRTLEILRVCVLPGVQNGCSMIYRALTRAGAALGYQRFVTYTLERETGASLRAAGFIAIASSPGGSWHCMTRPRTPAQNDGPKIRWELPR